MAGPSVMVFEEGADQKMGIRCKFINEWCEMEFYVPNKERLLSEIEENNPDVVFLDPNLYSKIDGIETTQTIRSQYNIPIIYM